MADDEPNGPEHQDGWSFKKAISWAMEYLELVRSVKNHVDHLTKENKALRRDFDELSDLVKDLNGQMKQIDKTILAHIEAEILKQNKPGDT